MLCPKDPKGPLKERPKGPKGPKDLNKGRSPRNLEVEDLIQSGTPKKDLRSKTEAEVKRSGTKVKHRGRRLPRHRVEHKD